jgi:hypothetical protein
LNYGNGVLDWRGLGFTKMKDFWDRHLYNGYAEALNIDANGGNQLGLAEFVNGNFLGQRHTYAEYFSPGDISYYPYPSLLTSTDYKTKRGHLASAADLYGYQNGQPLYRLYLNKTGDGVTFPHHSAVLYLGAKFPNNLPLAQDLGNALTTINDDSVLSNYHNIFIPKAVKYSAGLLDYFFRGTFVVSVSETTITIQNTSGQDFKGGSFLLMKDDLSGNGNRSYVDQFALSGTLPNGGTMNVTEGDLSGADPATKYTLVYQGIIGVDNSGNALDPVDTNICIAVKSFTPSSSDTCDGNPANIQGFAWTKSGNGTFPASGAGGDFSVTIDSSGGGNFNVSGYASLTNSSDCDVTVKMSAHFEWNLTALSAGQCAFYITSPILNPHGYPDLIWFSNPNIAVGTSDIQAQFTLPANSVTPITLSFICAGTGTGGTFNGSFSMSH